MTAGSTPNAAINQVIREIHVRRLSIGCGGIFSDSVESSDPAVADALRLSGAHPIQVFQYGIWPHARLLVWSHGKAGHFS